MNQNDKKQLNLIQASMNDIVPLVKEAVSEGGTVTIYPRGVSMLPMLRQGRDSVVLSKAEGRLKKYDIPLYMRENGSYILHRIIKVKNEEYTCVGDNQFAYERGVKHESVIAVVSAFTRDGKFYEVNKPSYKLYCRFWHITRFIRRVWRKIKRTLSTKPK